MVKISSNFLDNILKYKIMINKDFLKGIYKKTPSKKKQYEPKPYKQMTYPGERYSRTNKGYIWM